MAKIFKISGYFVDLNGNFDASGLAVSLRQSFDLIDHHIEVEEVNLPRRVGRQSPSQSVRLSRLRM